jgi:hypothetical protein
MADQPDKKTGGRLGGTRPGVGMDPKRPPARIDPGKRRLDRPVNVALAVKDPLERTTLAKSLIQAQCTVTMINSSADAVGADLDAIEVLVADFDAPEVFAIVEAIRKSHSDLAVLAWTSRKAMVERGLTAMGFSNVVALDRKSPVGDLIAGVQQLAGA